MRHINAFRVSTGELVWSGEFDPETTIFTEALEASGVPDLAEAATQSHHVDGEAWAEVRPDWSTAPLLRCRDFEVLLWTGSENQRGDAPSEVEEVVAPRKKKQAVEAEQPQVSPVEEQGPTSETQPTKPKLPPMKVVSFTRDLKVKLTPAEVAARADRAARLLEERDQEEAGLKAHASHVKSVIAQKEAEMRTASAEVRNQFTYGEVACERRYVYTTGCVQEVRLDTEEVIAERAMTEKEKQRDLPFLSPSETATELTEHGFADRKDTDA